MRALLGILGALTLAACSGGVDRAEEPSDDSALAAGDVVPANDASLWAATDYDSFKPWHQFSSYEHGEVLPDDAPVAKRLQGWVDRVDDAIRRDFRTRTNADLKAPKPVIKVLVSETLNAWVTSAPVCLSRPIAGFSPSKMCVHPSNFQPDDAVILKYLNGLIGPYGCELQSSETEYKLAPTADGGTCKLASANVDPALWAYLPVTSPYVHITTRMLARIGSEREIVGILVHELGHYYRAHSSVPTTLNPFWYTQGETPSSERPTPVSDDATLNGQAAMFSTCAAYPLFAGQTLSRRMTWSVLQLAVALGDNQMGAGRPCEAVSKALGGGWASRPLDPLDAAARTGYLALEQALLACADQIPVASGFGAATPPQTIPLEWVHDAIDPALFDATSTPATLGAAIYAAEGKARALDARERVFAGEIDARHLGQYTLEEEADDFSLEWASKIGLAPADVIASHVQTLHGYYAEEPRAFALDGIEWPACEALYAKKFRDGQGAAATTHFVPLGDIHEPHHGNCYRVFNFVRAQEAHQFKAASVAPFPAIDWEAIRADAARRTDEATAAARAAAPAPAPQAPSAIARALKERSLRITDRD